MPTRTSLAYSQGEGVPSKRGPSTQSRSVCLTAVPECTIAPVSGDRAQRGHRGFVQRFQAAYSLRAQGSAKVRGDEEEARAS